jgi:signal peptidase I
MTQPIEDITADIEPQTMPEAVPTPPQVTWERRLGSWTRDILETILPALVIVLVVNLFLAQATRVEGQSMEPNLHNNQRLVIEKVSYHFRPPQRGDIVVIEAPFWEPVPVTTRFAAWLASLLGRAPALVLPEPLIKRVVALPGETVETRNGRVYINGQELVEPYTNALTFAPGMSMTDMAPRVISTGHLFVLGDNRPNSNDSRSFGEIPYDDVIGHAWLRYWPIDSLGLLD